MGTVYLGRLVASHGISRLVALKSMHPQYALDPNFSAMFVDEARLTALLHHPNIVPTIDVVSHQDSLVLVMEYVEGSSLWQLVQQSSVAGVCFPLGVAAAMVHDLLSGLHYAHEARDEEGRPLGIVHRDVSPQNLIVGRDGLARVLDFGIARARGTLHASDTGAVRGKVAYMAPEQLCGREIDRRADVYAAGVVLWELLTGQRLFHGENMALVSMVLNGTVTAPSQHRPEISPELDAVVMRALAKNPGDRFPTAAAMADALARAVSPASRSVIASWISNEGTLASADPSWLRRSSSRTSTGAIVLSRPSSPSGIARLAQTDTLAPASGDPSTAPRSHGSWTPLTLAAFGMICALGIYVGARSDFAPSRHASAAEPHRAAESLPVPAASVVLAPVAPVAEPPPAPSASPAPVKRPAAPATVRPTRAKAAAPRFDSSLGF